MFLVNLLKKWTLPIAMFLGIIGFLMVKYLTCFQPYKPLLHSWIDKIIFISLFVLLFLTFCKVNPKKLRITRWQLLLFSLQTLLSVSLLLIVKLFSFSVADIVVIEAIFCCIVIPTAAAAAVVTGKLGGDITSSTSYSLASNLFSALLITFLCPLFQLHHSSNLIVEFFHVLIRVSQLLIAPFILSWVVRVYLPKFHAYCISFHNLAFYVWAFCLSLVMSQAVRGVVNNLDKIHLVVLIAIGALMICLLQFKIGERLGIHYKKKVTVRQCFGQRNTNFGVWLALVYFSPIVCVGPGFYALWQNLINSKELWKYERMEKAKMIVK